MAIQRIDYCITGTTPLLLNNPRTVDRFDPYAQKMAKINAKKNRRTDADYLEVRDLEVRSKIYWDNELKIYVPTPWMDAALAKNSFAQVKISKETLRGTVFQDGSKAKLLYRDMDKVAGPEDIVKNETFRYLRTVKQGQNRIIKAYPIFHGWSFSGSMEYDDKIIDPESMERLIMYVAKYGGFGDFRPSFGRAEAEVTHV